MKKLDRDSLSRVIPTMGRLSTFLLAFAVSASVAACGGKDKKKKTTPGSTGSVSAGGDLDPTVDPANIDPEGGFPDVAGGDPGDPGDPGNPGGGDDPDAPKEIKPPGLDMSPQEQAQRVAALLTSARKSIHSDTDAAIESARAALQVDETSVEAMVMLAHGNVVKGYYELAEDVLVKALKRGGNNNKEAQFLLGVVYEKTKREEKAPAQYRNALTIDPNYKSALMNLGASHLRAKRYDEAVRIFERLTSELKVDTAPAWTNLGSAYRGRSADFATSDVKARNDLILRAELAYKRAISKDKNYLNVYYNLGLLYLDADPFPAKGGDLDKLVRLKNAKTYLDEYRRLPGANIKLVDETAAVATKLISKEELLRKKQAERAAKLKALEEKRKARDAAKKNGGSDPDFDSDEGFE